MADTITADTLNDQPSDVSRGAETRVYANMHTDVLDYIDLLKPRVMSLVIFTGFVGLIMAPGSMNPILAFAAILLTAIGAGASGALNMWYDADIDKHMARTRSRPVPSGRIEPGEALGYGTALSVGSVLLMSVMVNVTAAVLLAITIFFYVIIYTIWLKRRTPHNIVIGGAAGAFPPMIGWAAVTNSVTLESMVLFGLIFLWTPPHFFALSLFISEDYKKAGVPMLPVVAGVKATRNQILAYSIILAPFALLPYFMGFAGPVYAITAAVFGAYFLYQAVRVWRGIEGADRKVFFFSIFYLFTLFAVMAIEHIVLEFMA